MGWLYVLTLVFLGITCWLGSEDDPRCNAWAWMTIALIVITLIVGVVTEGCPECWSG